MMVRRMAASVLCFEVLVILFFALVAMKLSDLSTGTVWAVCGPGMLVAALLCGMLRKQWAYSVGWVLQAALVVGRLRDHGHVLHRRLLRAAVVLGAARRAADRRGEGGGLRRLRGGAGGGARRLGAGVAQTTAVLAES